MSRCSFGDSFISFVSRLQDDTPVLQPVILTPHYECMNIVCAVCALILCFHHVFVVLVGEVKGRQDGLELVENLIMLGHVSGQNTPAGNTGEK